jgi:hypothetical protein
MSPVSMISTLAVATYRGRMSAMVEGEVYAPAGRASGGEKLAGIRSPAEAGPKGEGFRGKF